jgi:O-acetyl-ADP-ribose deacetylase
MQDKLEIYVGDITTLAVDAVVNAANDRLAGGGGVDGAIHRAAGHAQLQAACRELGGCPTGQVKVTSGFDLPAKYIFHAVGPVWRGGEAGEPELLASCYRRALDLAVEYGVNSLAFPAISCGVYCYPLKQAVNCAVETVVQALRDDPAKSNIKRVIFCCFGEDMAALYREKLDGTFPQTSG